MLLRIDVCQRKAPAADKPSSFFDIDRIGFRLSTVNGIHVKRVAESEM